MTVLTTFPNGGNLRDYRETFNAMLADIVALKAGGSSSSAPKPSFPKLAAGIARVKSGGARSVVPLVGDSVTDGWGGGYPTGPGSDAGGAGWSRVQSWPHQLAASLTAAGIPCRSDAFFPGVQQGTTIAQVQTANGGNVSFGAGWKAVGPSDIACLAGGFVCCPYTDTGAFVFTPEFTANRFDFLITGASSLGQFTVSDSSGVLLTVDETVVSGGVNNADKNLVFRAVTVSRAASSKAPITIQRVSGGDIYINAVIPYDTTAPRVELLNMGWPGSKSADWLTSGSAPWDPFNALGVFSGMIDGAFMELGANDANAGVSAATYQSNLQTLADKLAGYGDLWLVKCHKASDTSSAINIPAGYLTAIDTVQASKNSAAALNYNAIALVQADFADVIHLAAQGYGKEAAVALPAFRTATGA